MGNVLAQVMKGITAIIRCEEHALLNYMTKVISDWFLILILQRETCYIFCVQFPHTALTICIYLFVYESELFVTWSLLARERTLGMSVSVWQPLHISGVVCWRIISTCFLGAINLQGKEKSSLLTFFYCI